MTAMDVRRGKLQETVARGIEIDITRDELLTILTNFFKNKLKCVELKIDTLKGITSDAGNAQGAAARLEGMTLTGFETVQIPWPTLPVTPAEPKPVEPKPVDPKSADPKA
jgi:hypothetical protein